MSFAEQSGRKIPRRSESFVDEVERLQTEHLARIAAIEKLSVPEKIQNELIEEEEERFFRALEAAGSGNQRNPTARPQQDITSWFDQPQGDT